MGRYVLANASSADAVARAMVAMPVFVFKNFVKIVLVICAEAECTEFPIAFIIDILSFFAIWFVLIWI